MDEATIREIFLGGLHKLREAGVALLGGHTVQDKEIKFGYAVTGVVAPDAVWANAGAKAGDVLFLTKPLGTGVIATAIKFGRASRETMEAAIEVMVDAEPRRRRGADDAPRRERPRLHRHHRLRVHRPRERDGRGKRRHAGDRRRARCRSSRARSNWRANRSGGMKSNERHFAGGVAGAAEIDPAVVDLLFDPQTSGGLLAAVDPAAADQAAAALAAAGVLAARVGTAAAKTGEHHPASAFLPFAPRGIN